MAAIFVAMVIIQSFQDKNKPKAAQIAIGVKYYMNGMNTGMYQYLSHETSMPSGEIIEFKPQDSSYGIFESKQIFRISFMHENDPTEFRFIVTSFKQNKDGLRATVRHIYNGNVFTYTIRTTATEMVFYAPVAYDTKVASEQYSDSERITVVRNNAIMMSFLLNRPDYITEASR